MTPQAISFEDRLPSRIGVALSAGSAAAMAQIGALEALLASRIPIDCVAGTSAGSVVGASVAAGRLPGLRARLETADPRRVVSLFDPVWPRSGLIEGARGLDWIRPYLGESIEDLSLDFAAIATDLDTSEEVVLSSGSVTDAVRASIAFPGVFTPWCIDGRTLVDGGLVNPLPVSAVRRLGADFVIAINVLPMRTPGSSAPRRDHGHLRLVEAPDAAPPPANDAVPSRAPGLLGVLSQSARIVASEIARRSIRDDPPDFLIQIDVPPVGMFDLHRTRELVALGRKTTFDAIDALRRAIAGGAVAELGPALRADHVAGSRAFDGAHSDAV